MTEQEIIDKLSLGQRKAPSLHGIGDDGAKVVEHRVVTCDTMVEGIHWDEKLTPADVGWKIVAINASDIGAMGGLPEWCTLSLSLPSTTPSEWVDEFAKGMRAAMNKWNISLIGGDTTRSPKDIVVSMTMSSRKGYHWAWQNDAQAGDEIWVTGTLGDAASAFFEPDKHPFNTALQRPEPPVAFANTIVHNRFIHALTDISDGLHSEITRICTKSEVGAILDPTALPASSVLYNHKKALAFQTAFGEDYEYLFTAPKRSETVLRRTAARYKTTIHKIGRILNTSMEVSLKGKDWPEPLFNHFEKR